MMADATTDVVLKNDKAVSWVACAGSSRQKMLTRGNYSCWSRSVLKAEAMLAIRQWSKRRFREGMAFLNYIVLSELWTGFQFLSKRRLADSVFSFSLPCECEAELLFLNHVITRIEAWSFCKYRFLLAPHKGRGLIIDQVMDSACM
jgi:hypothetical protein